MDEIAALAEKFDEGLKVGHEQGIKIGTQQGKIEGKFEVAKAMLANNVDVDTVIKFTGLSLDEIKKLQE